MKVNIEQVIEAFTRRAHDILYRWVAINKYVPNKTVTVEEITILASMGALVFEMIDADTSIANILDANEELRALYNKILREAYIKEPELGPAVRNLLTDISTTIEECDDILNGRY